MKQHSIRRAQLVSPFGVGSVIEVGNESFACVDISRWDTAQGTVPIAGSDLARRLRAEVRTPVVGENGTGVPVVRFPRWLFCPSCRTMRERTPVLDEQNGFKPPRCGDCDLDLAPMGFVAACEGGHLQDVDWYRWAHRNVQPASTGQCDRSAAKLSFLSTGTSGGDWNALLVKCNCGAKSDFDGLVGPELPATLMRCRGGQPWQRSANGCDRKLRVFRRGAGNLYFPQVVSALDLLPAEGVPNREDIVSAIRAESTFGMIQAFAAASGGIVPSRDEAIIAPFVREFAARNGWDYQDVLDALVVACTQAASSRKTEPVPGPEAMQEEIFIAEWPMLSRTTPASQGHVDILPKAIPEDWPVGLRSSLQGIALVRRLREVRALVGFRRVSPDGGAPLIPTDLGAGVRWHPGVEVSGEGLFVRFREESVAAWEAGVASSLSRRLDELREWCKSRGLGGAYATPRFIMLHTFAHVFMRRLAFDAGYSAASLRERVYASTGTKPMAGVLVYTADSDSEGSLGGLVRMGDPSRLNVTISNALWDASWCSADPVCRETPRQGVGGSNGAACHACCLSSETSCAHGNALLDRTLLLKSPGVDKGFFETSGLL
jgi:hypothetical protein